MSAALELPNRTAEAIAFDLLEAKKAEAAATAHRVALEEELTGSVDGRKVDDEGAKTYSLDGYKVEIERKLNRKVVKGGLASIKLAVPTELCPVKVKEELDATGVKYLQNNEPQIFKKIAKFIETSPAKVSVKVTRVD